MGSLSRTSAAKKCVCGVLAVWVGLLGANLAEAVHILGSRATKRIDVWLAWRRMLQI